MSWEELNAAWGQTGFLLDSLIQLTLEIYYRQLALAKTARRNTLIGTQHSGRAAEQKTHGSRSPTVQPSLESETSEIANPSKDGASEDSIPSRSQEEIKLSHNTSVAASGNSRSIPQLQNLQSYRILPRGSFTVILRRVIPITVLTVNVESWIQIS